MTTEPKYLTIQATAELLHTTRRRIWRMIRDRELQAVENPLDRREKLVLMSDVARLAEFADRKRASDTSGSETRSQPRTFGMVDDPGLQSKEIEDYLLAPGGELDSESDAWLGDEDLGGELPPYDWGSDGPPVGNPVRYEPGLGIVVVEDS